ncbi:UbiA prenyltransferase family-domain-containing protein [Dipodascopsis uninucleata]
MKPSLTALVVLSSMAAYALLPDSPDGKMSVLSLLWLTAGATLTSGSANAFNMAREPKYDKLMSRTRGRPIVRGILTSKQAAIFATAIGATGLLILYFGVNTETALLAAGNIVLYSWVYTTLKRTSIVNTWVGAVVGAIPPLMGWSAAGGSLLDPGAWCCAGLLYAWQFPHFNALSFPVRDEYRMAGYRMTAWVNPVLNARVALRYSILMVPICIGFSYFGLTDWFFAADSTLVNSWMIYKAGVFLKECKIMDPTKATAAANVAARGLFWASIWQLPAVLLLAMVHKTGLWDGVFNDDIPIDEHYDEEVLKAE